MGFLYLCLGFDSYMNKCLEFLFGGLNAYTCRIVILIPPFIFLHHNFQILLIKYYIFKLTYLKKIYSFFFFYYRNLKFLLLPFLNNFIY